MNVFKIIDLEENPCLAPPFFILSHPLPHTPPTPTLPFVMVDGDNDGDHDHDATIADDAGAFFLDCFSRFFYGLLILLPYFD